MYAVTRCHSYSPSSSLLSPVSLGALAAPFVSPRPFILLIQASFCSDCSAFEQASLRFYPGPTSQAGNLIRRDKDLFVKNESGIVRSRMDVEKIELELMLINNGCIYCFRVRVTPGTSWWALRVKHSWVKRDVVLTNIVWTILRKRSLVCP